MVSKIYRDLSALANLLAHGFDFYKLQFKLAIHECQTL